MSCPIPRESSHAWSLRPRSPIAWPCTWQGAASLTIRTPSRHLWSISSTRIWNRQKMHIAIWSLMGKWRMPSIRHPIGPGCLRVASFGQISFASSFVSFNFCLTCLCLRQTCAGRSKPPSSLESSIMIKQCGVIWQVEERMKHPAFQESWEDAHDSWHMSMSKTHCHVEQCNSSKAHMHSFRPTCTHCRYLLSHEESSRQNTFKELITNQQIKLCGRCHFNTWVRSGLKATKKFLWRCLNWIAHSVVLLFPPIRFQLLTIVPWAGPNPRFRQKFMRRHGWIYVRWGGSVFGQLKWRGLALV